MQTLEHAAAAIIPATVPGTTTMTPLATRVPQHVHTPDALPGVNAALREASTARLHAMDRALSHLTRYTVDAVIPTPALRVDVLTDDRLAPADRLKLVAKDQQGHEFGLRVLDGAHEQLAQKLDVPRKFYDRLLTDHPDLLAHTVGALLQREPAAFMLRMLNPLYSDTMRETAGRMGAHYAVRAIVSDRYRPLDHAGLMNVLVEEARARDLLLADWHLDDRRFSARFSGPERTVAQIREAHGFKAEGDNYHRVENGVDLAWVNEVLSFGVEVTNSETGHGSLAVRQFSRVLRCLNAYVRDEQHRTVHVGRKQTKDADTFLVSAETQRLEAAVQFGRVKDRFIDAVSATRQTHMAKAFANAMGHVLELPPEVPALRFIDAVGLTFEMTDREREVLQDEFVSELTVTNATHPSAFNVAQAMTATAQRVETFTRRQEVEAIGWRIIEDPTATLVKAAQDAVKATAK